MLSGSLLSSLPMAAKYIVEGKGLQNSSQDCRRLPQVSLVVYYFDSQELPD